MPKRPPSLTVGARARPKRKAWASTRTSRAARGYGWQWEKQRARILKRDKRLCQSCLKAGRSVVASDVDHIVPRSAGGSEDDANLQALCRDCHKAKTAREAKAGRS